MSRFWAAGGSSDSDSSGSDASSFYSSEDDGNKGGGLGGGAGGAGGDNKWVAMSDDSDSSDEVRVVKSGKERALDTFRKYIGGIRSAMKARDYYAIQTEFDELMKSMIKAKAYLKEGVPKPLVRILVDLEDYNEERLKDKAQFKTLSARQGRALNRMKLTLKKHNKAYKIVIDAYRKNPIVSSDGESEAEKDADSDSDSDNGSSSSSSDDDDDDKKKKVATKKKKADSDSDAVRCFSCYCFASVPVERRDERKERKMDVSLGCFSNLACKIRIPRFRCNVTSPGRCSRCQSGSYLDSLTFMRPTFIPN
jgi:translation initiation factor 3 subunit C